MFTPPGGFHATFSGTDVTFQVFEFAGNVTDICQLVEAPVVATGTGTLRLRQAGPGPGAIAFHAFAEGTVTLTSGGAATLNIESQFVQEPDGSVAVDFTRITLTPL